jgi:hypothetical protein
LGTSNSLGPGALFSVSTGPALLWVAHSVGSVTHSPGPGSAQWGHHVVLEPSVGWTVGGGDTWLRAWVCHQSHPESQSHIGTAEDRQGHRGGTSFPSKTSTLLFAFPVLRHLDVGFCHLRLNEPRRTKRRPQPAQWSTPVIPALRRPRQDFQVTQRHHVSTDRQTDNTNKELTPHPK